MTETLIAALVQYLAVPLIVAAGAWLVTKLPGPAREFLESGVHKRDIELLLGAMARRATAAIGGMQAAPATVADVIGYAATELPATLRKLDPSPDALATMAAAAIAQAAATVAKPAA